VERKQVGSLLRQFQIFEVAQFGFMDVQGEINKGLTVASMKMNELVKSWNAERIQKLRIFVRGCIIEKAPLILLISCEHTPK
jgi:hypothetical protein